MTTAYLGRTSNVFGALEPDIRKRLERVIANPTQRTWEDAYSIIICARKFSTLWQAWVAVDDSAPRSKPCDGKWPRIPDQLTLYRAIKHATGAGHE
jgi:hypothetical protein